MVSTNKHIQNLNDKFIELDRLADHDDEKDLVRRIKSNFHDLSKRIQTDLVHLVENKASKDEFAKLDNLIDTSGDLIEADLASIADSVQKEQKEANEALSALMSRSSIVGQVTFFLTLGITLQAIYLISRSIVKPIRSTIEGLNDGAEQVASASGQVSAASQSLAEGSSEQAAAIEETSSSLEEMASMTKQNAEHAGQADMLMKASNAVVEEIAAASHEQTQGIEQINSAVADMDKVTQQNAASAEESASASEQMKARRPKPRKPAPKLGGRDHRKVDPEQIIPFELVQMTRFSMLEYEREHRFTGDVCQVGDQAHPDDFQHPDIHKAF